MCQRAGARARTLSGKLPARDILAGRGPERAALEKTTARSRRCKLAILPGQSTQPACGEKSRSNARGARHDGSKRHEEMFGEKQISAALADGGT